MRTTILRRSAVRVAYVDDEQPILSIVERVIGSRVHLDTFRDPAEALARVREGHYHVVMTDMRMPGHDGIEVLRAARAARQETIRIIVTAVTDFETALSAINEVGVFRFLVKPWTPDELLQTLDSALELISMREENERVRGMLERRNRELLEINTRLDKLVAERTAGALAGLISALDLRDTETWSHSRRVALYARRLAEQMELSPEECVDIERGALLHDIGKIGVSDTILRKAGNLNEAEWVEMRKHALLGARILERVEFLQQASLLVAQHHERWDGRGYPRGLGGESIYLGARVFAVIDTYDAVTSNRPYRQARSHDVAVEEIRRCTSSQFDPQVAAAFEHVPAADFASIQAICSEDVPAPVKRETASGVILRLLP